MAIINTNTPYDPNEIFTSISIGAGGSGRPANFGIFGTVGTNGNISSPINVNNYAIEGKMFKAIYTVTAFEKLQFSGDEDKWKDHVKGVLTQKLAESLMNEKYIEFTRLEENPGTDATRFTARMFAVPDGQVRLLRVHNKA